MKRTFPTTLKINLLSSAHPSHTGMKSYMLQNRHMFGYFDFSVLTRALGTPEYVPLKFMVHRNWAFPLIVPNSRT